MSGTNAPAYVSEVSKRYITLVLGVSVIKLFSFPLMLQQNKLERSFIQAILIFASKPRGRIFSCERPRPIEIYADTV